MLTNQERLRALLCNIKSWSWDIFPKFSIDKDDADALIGYFKEHDKNISGSLETNCKCK